MLLTDQSQTSKFKLRSELSSYNVAKAHDEFFGPEKNLNKYLTTLVWYNSSIIHKSYQIRIWYQLSI